jgi:hypothetical protein
MVMMNSDSRLALIGAARDGPFAAARLFPRVITDDDFRYV